MSVITPIKTDQLYIGGRWVAPHSTERLEVFSPATGELIGRSQEQEAYGKR